MGGIKCLKEPLKTAQDQPQPQVIDMELKFFEEKILPTLKQSAFYCDHEKLETETQYIYIITMGTDYEGYESYSFYFDKN